MLIECETTPLAIPESETRARPALVQDADGCWFAAVALFENADAERLGIDMGIEDYCDHRHHTEKAARRCLPLMRGIAADINAEFADRPPA